MDLLVLAAGMGSRFGGLKQLEPVGVSGEFILDYSIKDAIDAGFKKVVFVIKRENLNAFKETIGKRLEDKIKVEYAFQDVEDIPVKIPVVQAILCAKDYIDNNFAIINADDFYGKDAFLKAMEELKKINEPNKFSCVLYEAKATLSENGEVKRGVCQVLGNKVKGITESSVSEKNGKLICEPLLNDEVFETSLDTLVSMNMFLFNKSIFKLLENEFANFLKNTKDLENDECLITTVINDYLSQDKIELNYVKTSAKWIGMTYRSDLELVKKEILKLIEQKEYKESLWS